MPEPRLRNAPSLRAYWKRKKSSQYERGYVCIRCCVAQILVQRSIPTASKPGMSTHGRRFQNIISFLKVLLRRQSMSCKSKKTHRPAFPARNPTPAKIRVLRTNVLSLAEFHFKAPEKLATSQLRNILLCNQYLRTTQSFLAF